MKGYQDERGTSDWGLNKTKITKGVTVMWKTTKRVYWFMHSMVYVRCLCGAWEHVVGHEFKKSVYSN